MKNSNSVRCVSSPTPCARCPACRSTATAATARLTQVRIRGSESNQTLVLIDGIEVNDPAGASEFNFAHLLVQDIERIEVLRGPQSALYGSDAIGGVVNIISRKGEGPAKVSAYAEGGNRATAAGGASLSGSSERVDYFFSAAGLRTDGFSAASEWRGNAEKDGYENFSGFAKLGFQALDNLRFDVVGRGMDYYAEGDDEAPFRLSGGAYDFLNDVDGREAFGRVQAKLDLFDGTWQQILGASQLNHRYDYLYDVFPPTNTKARRRQLDYRSNLFLTSGTDFDHTLSFVAEHEIDGAQTEGFELRRRGLADRPCRRIQVRRLGQSVPDRQPAPRFQ